MPERIAHRGASMEYLENTLPAFRRALELGADAIELDVRVTRDGVVVVHHDPVVVPPDGPAVSIDMVTWEELSGVELARAVQVPSLGDVLSLVGDRATVYVELKAPGIEAIVLDTIRTGRARCAVHSFHHDDIAKAARLRPEVPRGLLFEEYPLDPAGDMRRAGARDLWPHWSLVDSRLVERVHDVGGRVIAWTVNEPADVDALVSMHVDAICTDDVRLLPLS